MTASAEEDEFTELVGATFPRVDLVGKGANGIPRFLIAKQASGLLPADYVRDLIAKSEPEPSGREQVEMPNGITVSGSPADIAAFIHKAAERHEERTPAEQYEAIVKAKYDTADRKRMAASGAAMKDGSYPIEDEADLKKAIRAVGRGGGSHDAIRRHIIKRAKSLGKSSLIPDDWGADGSIKKAAEPVAKDAADVIDPELDGGRDGMDPTVPFTGPGDDDAPGDPTDPGSPAWEAIDAATAQKWLAIASRLDNALGLLADREMLEAATADPGDAEQAWNLQDARCALEYVISTLAVFAAGEQAEAELGTEMEAVGKMLAGMDAAPLGVIEGLAAVKKAGRVLSSANEAAIRGAVEQLQRVLASLPEAPVAKEATVADVTDPAAEVAKEAEEAAMPQPETSADRTAEAGQEPVMGTAAPAGVKKAKAARVRKAKAKAKAGEAKVAKGVAGLPVAVFGQDGSLLGHVPQAAVGWKVAKADGDEKAPMQAVFDQSGELIGVVDPAQIQPVAGAAPAKQDAEGGGSTPEPSTAPAGDLQPQPAAAVGTPAEGVAKAGGTEETTAGDEPAGKTGKPGKGKPRKKIAKALAAQSAAHEEVVAKMAADRDEQAERIAALTARLETVEKMSAPPRVFTSGQVPRGPVPPPEHLRGHDQGGAQQIDVAKGLARKREMYTAPAAEQNRIAKEMEADAVAALTALHARGPGQQQPAA